MTFIKKFINNEIQIKKLSIFKIILNILSLGLLTILITFIPILLMYKLDINSYLITSIIIVISFLVSIFILILFNTEKESNNTNILSFSKTKEPSLKFNKNILKYSFMIGCGFFLINSSTLHFFTPKIKPVTENAVSNGVNQGFFFLFIIIVFIGPFIEEILLRGFFLNGLLKQYSPKFAIIISSIVFGIFHGNIPQFITAVIIGFILGLVYHHTNSLITCIIIHISNNISLFLIAIPSIIIPSNISNIIFFIIGCFLFKSGFCGLNLNKAFENLF